MKIDWQQLKTTIAPCEGTTSKGQEYRHVPSSYMRVEYIEVRDGDEAIKIHRTPYTVSGWTRPYRVTWMEY